MAAGVIEPEAMALATASADGMPSVRFVLLKGIDDRGVEFFTNYESRKGSELIANPRASLAVLWKPLQRQVRLEGPVEVLTPEESDAYFASRSRGSQLGAWASKQSEVIPDRDWLEARLASVDAEYPDTVPRPPHWGGFRLVPSVDRVLGRPPEPPARPRGVPARRGWLDLAPAVALGPRRTAAGGAARHLSPAKAQCCTPSKRGSHASSTATTHDDQEHDQVDQRSPKRGRRTAHRRSRPCTRQPNHARNCLSRGRHHATTGYRRAAAHPRHSSFLGACCSGPALSRQPGDGRGPPAAAAADERRARERAR